MDHANFEAPARDCSDLECVAQVLALTSG
ncbi:MAG: hypothetical protein ABWY47_18040 [Xanthobacteraceae bacterium]